MRIIIIRGTRLADDLRGTGRRDLILAFGGDDVVYSDGRVSVESQQGGTAELTGTSDLLDGGSGHDTLFGDGVVEILARDGFGGSTFLRGGDDGLSGEAGNDTLYGEGWPSAPCSARRA